MTKKTASTSEMSAKSAEIDSIPLDHDTAALVIKSDGSVELYVPKGPDDYEKAMPEHSVAIAALGSYWVEYSEEIVKWFQERMEH